ncbi:MAG: glycosyltransferase [Candidatus Competibacterales bacterium]|nr:glycosyltransferase [Candidatus Competibacterales bacterium]
MALSVEFAIHTRMTRINALVVVALVALVFVSWAGLNRPVAAPDWNGPVQGYAFSPARVGQDPARGVYPTLAEIETDLARLAGTARALRTYSLDGSLGAIPELALRHGLTVTQGVWLTGDPALDEAHLGRLLKQATTSDNIAHAIVGNETLLREKLTPQRLIAYLDRMRARLDIPVSTAEPWHVWLRHPELAAHVDIITVHLLPYWEGVPVEAAVDFVRERMDTLRAAFPDRPIVIGEVGWPSRGRDWDRASASPAAQALFLRRFLQLAEREGYDYFLLEAFDQPWKRATEGEVGAHWGVRDLDRQPKFAFAGPLVPIPHWPGLALLSALLGAGVFLLLVRDGRGLGAGGRVFLALVAAGLASLLVWVAQDHARQYWTVSLLILGTLMSLGLIGLAATLLVEAHEWAEARWIGRRRRAFVPPAPAGSGWPRVSIHVPAHDEPPAMLAETLHALAALDYPDFEVLVIDNNTRDERVWRPIEALCARLGPRFRFFHRETLPGYKAGALNLALRHTAPDAEIVAVVDSDYQVRPEWLRDLVGAFADADTAIVQAPQDYRDAEANAFKTLCEVEYRGFFHIGMVTRNDRDAIIQHGTMTLIRREALERVGGWAEWTITEDAELGLRILRHGYRSLYIPRSYGRGLTPDTFQDYKAQRFRWVFGAMQILRRHRHALFGSQPGTLDRGQRYHFVAGWLPWIADGLNLLVCVAALVWAVLILLLPARFDPPPAVFSLPPLALFGFRLLKTAHLYRHCVRASPGRTLQAMLAGLGLTYTVGRAVLSGLCRREAGFARTPKLAPRHSLVAAFVAARTETLLACALLAAAASAGIGDPHGGTELSLWRTLLVVLALPHLAATGMALASAWPRPRALRTDPAPVLGKAVRESGESSR